MMKKSRLTRLFSLFAALMMCVSMLSAVASASDSGIQPHVATCDCGGVYEFFRLRDMHTIFDHMIPQCGARHERIEYYREYRCSGCDSRYLGELEKVEEFCDCMETCVGGCKCYK